MTALDWLDEMVDRLRRMLPQAVEKIDGGDLEAAERMLHDECAKSMDRIVGACVTKSLAAPSTRKKLAATAKSEGLVFHHVQPVAIRLSGGSEVVVNSPWFRRSGKAGKRKRGPKSRESSRKGCHLGLERLGVEGKCSPALLDCGVRLAATMPSFETASAHLEAEGTPLSTKAVRAAVASYGGMSYGERASHAVGSGAPPFAGMRVQLSVDGGRARERKAKEGRVPAELKRRGFHTPWREAMMFTLFVVDDDGSPIKDIPPLVDGVVDGEARHSDFLRLLSEYVVKSGAAACSELILVCDGAPWHWKEIPATLAACGVENGRITQVLDYTHAKQNLHELVDLCACHALAPKEHLLEEAGDHLYNGDVEALSDLLRSRAARGNKRKVTAKLNSYFLGNAERMNYSELSRSGTPIGSGAVESAIRRVLNLRIKAPDSFWIPANAEAMIFVRANLLYGRWTQVREARHNARRRRFGDSQDTIQAEAAA